MEEEEPAGRSEPETIAAAAAAESTVGEKEPAGRSEPETIAPATVGLGEPATGRSEPETATETASADKPM